MVAPREELVASGDGMLEATWDGGLLRPVSAPLVAPASGAHWLALAVRDRAGNLSVPRWIRVEVDGRPPAVGITVAPAPVAAEDGEAAWVKIGARAEVRAEDRPAGVATLRLAAPTGTVETTGEPAGAELGTAGAAMLTAEAVDRVGNRGAASLALRVDGAPPTVSWRFTGPQYQSPAGDWIVGPTTGLAAEVADGESGVGGWTPTTDGEPSTVEALVRPWPAGLHRAAGEAWDRVGNRANAPEIAFRVDGTPPAITAEVTSEQLVGLGGSPLYRRPVQVRVAATDDAAGVASLEQTEGAAGQWVPAGGELSVAGPELRLRAVDHVGNAAERVFSYPGDDTPPRITLRTARGEVGAGQPARVTYGEEIHFEVLEEGSGLASTTYSLGGSHPLPLPRALAIDTSFRGRKQLVVEAVDRLGNRGQALWTLEILEAEP